MMRQLGEQPPRFEVPAGCRGEADLDQRRVAGPRGATIEKERQRRTGRPHRHTRARCHPETRAYLDRKRAEGKSTKEAIRCLKRHLARRIWHLLVDAAPPAPGHPHPSTS